MNRPRRNRYRTGGLLLVVAGLLAAVGVFAGLAAAKDGNHRAEKRHHHGHRGHHHSGGTAGTIASFDTGTGRLVIALTGGETIGGLVTDRTRIRCEDEHAPDITQLRHGGSESGDDHGGQGEEPGDDNGGHGEEEQGDDHGGGDNSNRGPSGHDDNGSGANCTTSDLIVGAVVQKAELEIEDGGATFEEIELAN